MKVELAYGDAVGQRRPLAMKGAIRGQAEEGGAATDGVRITECQAPGVDHRGPVQRRQGDGGVVDDAVAHHLQRFVVDGGIGCGDDGDLVGELLLLRQHFTFGVCTYLVDLHR